MTHLNPRHRPKLCLSFNRNRKASKTGVNVIALSSSIAENQEKPEWRSSTANSSFNLGVAPYYRQSRGICRSGIFGGNFLICRQAIVIVSPQKKRNRNLNCFPIYRASIVAFVSNIRTETLHPALIPKNIKRIRVAYLPSQRENGHGSDPENPRWHSELKPRFGTSRVGIAFLHV